jgi:hypothetical protein
MQRADDHACQFAGFKHTSAAAPATFGKARDQVLDMTTLRPRKMTGSRTPDASAASDVVLSHHDPAPTTLRRTALDSFCARLWMSTIAGNSPESASKKKLMSQKMFDSYRPPTSGKFWATARG